MNTSHIASIERTAGLIRRIFSPAVLALAFLSLMPLLGGCRCPEANHPGLIKEDPEQAVAIKARLDQAAAKKTWTAEDERAFKMSLGQLSPETRFASRVRLATLINSQSVKIVRPSKAPPPPLPTCTCTPGMCDRAATPSPAAQPRAASVPPPSAPPPRAK